MVKKIQNKNRDKFKDKPINQGAKSETPAKKPPFWFFLIPILIPVIFFILLELFLRVFNYGADYTQWIKIENEKYILNPELMRKYFSTTAAVPTSNGNFFDVEKAPNAIRVFILGESSAAGYPYSPNGDFGKYVRKRLELLYPENKIEVINLGITAVNSYTIRDIFPGVLDQKPDLILIYTGHNEYYGALGVGSIESLGGSRALINTALWLSNFKTTQLVRNIIKWGAGIFSSSDDAVQPGTLMSKMAKDQYIAYNSETFNNGIEQFEGNMRDILKMAADNNVKVLLSTLTSNLKDQYPFISLKNNYPEAAEVYKKGQSILQTDPAGADSLFRFAKDLDALRFRAPERINNIIRNLAAEFNFPLVNADSVFASASPSGITGKELMTDHLHPNLGGYQLLGRSFIDQIKSNKVLKQIPVSRLTDAKEDSVVKLTYNFSHLDSVIAKYRIIILRNDWPFSKPMTIQYVVSQMNPQNYLDTLGLKVVEKSIDWEAGHRAAADYYLRRGDYKGYAEEMLVVIDQYPIIESYYSSAEVLLEKKEYHLASEILERKHKVYPDAFTAKWIGNIALSDNNSIKAIKFLKESLIYNGSDEQVLFNIAGAYAMEMKFQEAYDAINKCMQINPDFPGAYALKTQLEEILRK